MLQYTVHSYINKFYTFITVLILGLLASCVQKKEFLELKYSGYTVIFQFIVHLCPYTSFGTHKINLSRFRYLKKMCFMWLAKWTIPVNYFK